LALTLIARVRSRPDCPAKHAEQLGKASIGGIDTIKAAEPICAQSILDRCSR